MAATGEETNLVADPAHLQAIAIVLDFFHPAGVRRRLHGAGGNEGRNVPVRAKRHVSKYRLVQPVRLPPEGIGFCEGLMSHPMSDCPGDSAILAMLRLFERRLVSRHRTSQVGKIILHQRRPDTVCMVRDISPAGGLLFMSNAYGLPEEFNLQMDGYSRRCIARWRRLDRIGVQFKSTAAA
jgi:hypothetical protein